MDDEERLITDPRFKHAISSQAAADICGVFITSLRQFANSGQLKGARFGTGKRGQWIFDERTVRAFQEERLERLRQRRENAEARRA